MYPYEFYGAEYPRLEKTRRLLVSMVEGMKDSEPGGRDVQQIVYCCSRIKRSESMKDKLRRYGLPVTLKAALEDVYDAVGVRVICSFSSDVTDVVERLEREPGIEVIIKKDYLSRPKESGYRSIHLCILVKETGALAEIQVRTIAMDFWATLEHQIRYKKRVGNDPVIRSELRRCADEIASVDLSMQTMREIIYNAV